MDLWTFGMLIKPNPVRLSSAWQFSPANCFLQNTCSWDLGPHLCDLLIFYQRQQREINKPGYPNYEPVMFDMDLFGGKKVSCNKYLESI